ncbi:Rhodocoxin reductase [compost metagenome]
MLAAGDCARFPNPYGADPAQPLRLESIQAANDLARAAASVIAGQPAPYQAVPWFWSDQYASKLQIAGLGLPGDARVLRGSPDEGRFSLFLLRAGRVVCVHSINRPAEHLLARKLIESRVQASAAALADPDFVLKSLLDPGPAATL